MTETQMTRVNVTMYRDTQIQVDERGQFYATPPGARKERSASGMYEMHRVLDKYFDAAAQKKRKGCDVPFKYWDEDAGRVYFARYLGTRGRATANHEVGHAMQRVDDGSYFTIDRFTRKMRVLTSADVEEARKLLEIRHDALKTAKRLLAEAVVEYTEELECGYIPYAPDVNELNTAQDVMIARIQNAMKPKEEATE